MASTTYMDASKGLRSGQVAELAGVNVETLRYYERRGLLAEPLRSPGGHRLYRTRFLHESGDPLYHAGQPGGLDAHLLSGSLSVG